MFLFIQIFQSAFLTEFRIQMPRQMNLKTEMYPERDRWELCGAQPVYVRCSVCAQHSSTLVRFVIEVSAVPSI